MASDNFALTNNPLAAPWAAGNGSPAWGALQSASGLCLNAAGSDTDSLMRFSISTALRSIIEYRSGTFDGGAAFCDASGNGYISTFYTGTTGEIYRITAGANYSLVGSNFTVSFVAGDTQELRIDGNDLVCFKNGAEVARRTDSTFRSGLNPAIFMFAGNLRVDNWTDGVVDLITGLPLFMRPGPGVPMHRVLYFLPQRFAATNMPADTSLAATLSSVSTLTADLTAIGRTGYSLRSGPGLSPDYMFLFRAQLGSAASPINDTSLSATLSSSSTLTASLTTAITLAASLSCVSTLNAGLTTAIPLQATLSSSSTLTASLTTAIPLQAAIASTSTITASLSTAIPLQAALSSVSTLTAALTTAIPLAASLASVATLSGALTTAIPLQAALAGVSTLQGTLDGTPAALQAALSSVSTLTAALTTAIPLQAALTGVSTLNGQLTTAIRLQAALSSVSSMTGTLSNAAVALEATLSSLSTLTAQLTTAIPLTASLVSVSTLTASLGGTAAALEATLASISTLLAELSDAPGVLPSAVSTPLFIDGEFASFNPYVSTITGVRARGDIPVARFGWYDAAANNIGYARTPTALQVAFVGRIYELTRALYVDRGLIWLRSGYPVNAYLQGDFLCRFPEGATAGQRVYASVLDGTPYSGYAVNALQTPWSVVRTAPPGQPTVISSWGINV